MYYMLDSSHHQQGIGHTDTSVGIAVKQDGRQPRYLVNGIQLSPPENA